MKYILGSMLIFCGLMETSLSAAEPRPAALTATVKAGGMELKVVDLMMKMKVDHSYLMWDAFPYREALQKAGGHKALVNVVGDLVRGALHEKYPKADKTVVDVVEFSGRDEYGMPRWDTLKKLARFNGKLGSKKKWVLKEEE